MGDASAPSEAPLGSARPRWRRRLRLALLAVGTLVALVVVWLIGLLLTNPSPSPSRGWTRHAELPSSRGESASAVRGDELLVIGGFWMLGGRDDTLTDAVSIYDPATDAWSAGPELPEAMSAMAVGVLDDTVHVVGGEDPSLLGGRVFDWHFVLRPGAAGWEGAAPPILAVHGASFGVVGDRLLIAGGSPRQGPLSPLAWSGVTQSHPSDPDE